MAEKWDEAFTTASSRKLAQTCWKTGIPSSWGWHSVQSLVLQCKCNVEIQSNSIWSVWEPHNSLWDSLSALTEIYLWLLQRKQGQTSRWFSISSNRRVTLLSTLGAVGVFAIHSNGFLFLAACIFMWRQKKSYRACLCVILQRHQSENPSCI